MNALTRLTVVIVFAFGLGACSEPGEYPSKPITIVVSFAAGGNADIINRLGAEALSKELGVPVNILNKPGGAHIPAVMSVLNAPADGYTLINWAPPSFILVPLTRDVPYEPLEDFIPLFAGITASNVLYVRKDSPFRTFEEFIESAKANKLTMGVNNLGAPPNLAAVQLADEFGLEFKTLQFSTVPKTLVGLIGGQVDVAVGQVASIHAYKDDLRPLIILDNNRQPYFEKNLPGVRTVGEAAPGKTVNSWVHGGLAVRAGTPPEILDRLIEATKALGAEEFISKVPPAISYQWIHGPEAVKEKMAAGNELYSPVLDSLGLLNEN